MITDQQVNQYTNKCLFYTDTKKELLFIIFEIEFCFFPISINLNRTCRVFPQVLKNLLHRRLCALAVKVVDEVLEEVAVLLGSESTHRTNKDVTFVLSAADPTLPIT